MIGRRIAAALVGAALTIGLAACATPSIESATAARLQDTVVAVAEHASSGDRAAALAQLDALQAQLDSAVGADLITAARAASVQEAIDVVRADLEALAATEPDATPEPPAETTPVDDGNGDDGADDGDDDDNRGPGNNNGKGKGAKDD